MAFGPIAGAAGRGFASAASRRAFFAKLGKRGASSAEGRLARGRARRAGEHRLERRGRGRGRGRMGKGRGRDEAGDSMEAVNEEAVSEAGEEALASAGNAGQESILERCVDGWMDYALAQLNNEEDIDEDEIRAMTSYPDAVSEIIQTFIGNCYDFSGG